MSDEEFLASYNSYKKYSQVLFTDYGFVTFAVQLHLGG